MENLHGTYLIFITDSLYYLLPLSEVGRIMDGSKEVQFPVIDFSDAVDGRSSTEQTGDNYVILLRTAEERLGILVERIIGIFELESAKQFELMPPVVNSRNRYLKAAVRTAPEGEDGWAYLLNLEQLLKLPVIDGCIDGTENVPPLTEGDEGSSDEKGNANIKENERGGKAGNADLEMNEPDLSEIRYIILENGRHILCIDKNMVAAVVMRPEITRVPMASGHIIGISMYDDQLVAYYDYQDDGSKRKDLENAAGYQCGVIYRTSQGALAGLAGDMTAGIADAEWDAEIMVSVGKGIWERKCD